MAKRETQSARTPTRKQIALSRKEREQLRLIYIGLGVVVALVVIVLGYGVFQTYVLEPNSPVATINDTDVITRDYQTRVRYERFMLDQQIQQLQAQRQSLIQSGDQQLAELLVGQYDQQLNQLQQQRFVVDTNTLDVMIEDVLVEAEAAQRGITASEDEITEAINRFLAQQSNGLTEAAASETVMARIEASATALLWTPTPTFTPSPTLTATGQITPTATPANTPTPAPTPTLNIISTGDLSTQYANWLNILDQGVDMSEIDYRRIVRTIVLREKLQEALGSEAPTSAEHAHARHILVETEEEANEVIRRLEAGEDFADLAAELSQDPGSGAAGGDLGFTPPGRFVGPFDAAVSSLSVGEVSEPIETQFGWHVIEVLEREERELSPADYRFSQQLAYREWLDEARAAATIEDFWSVDKVPEDPLFEGRLQAPQLPPQ